MRVTRDRFPRGIAAGAVAIYKKKSDRNPCIRYRTYSHPQSVVPADLRYGKSVVPDGPDIVPPGSEGWREEGRVRMTRFVSDSVCLVFVWVLEDPAAQAASDGGGLNRGNRISSQSGTAVERHLPTRCSNIAPPLDWVVDHPRSSAYDARRMHDVGMMQ